MAPKRGDMVGPPGQVAGFERRFNKFGIDRKATKQVVRIFSSAFLSRLLNGFKSTFYNSRSFAA